MPPFKDNRRDRRIAYAGPIRISWEDRGQSCFAICKCLDLSQTGLRIESPQPVRVGANILLYSERIKVSGGAVVKHTQHRGCKHVIGVQLKQAELGKAVAELEARAASSTGNQ